MTLADRPTSQHRMHYEDVAKFSWGGCNGVDISQTEYSYFYFCLSHPKLTWPYFQCLHMMEPNDLDPNTPYKQLIFNILFRFINLYFYFFKSHLVKDVLGVP